VSAVDNPGQRMEEARRPVPKPRSRNRRRWAQVLLAVVAAGTAVLALIFLPYHTTSRELTIPPRGSASTQLSIPQPGWVTVHFNHLGIWQLQYWIDLSTADSTNQSQLVGGGAYASWTYAFWVWGGTFRCGATYVGPAGNSTTLAWVNASWGVL